MTAVGKSTSDGLSRSIGSYAREGVLIGDRIQCRWHGYATVLAGVTAAALDITIPSQQRGKADTSQLILPANAFITSIGLHPQGALTLGAATGKLKLAATLTAATATLYAETAAAAANVLAKPANANVTSNLGVTLPSAGGSAVTFKIFATDGGAAGAAAASTVTAAVDTKVLVSIGFIVQAPFPTTDEVGYAAPKN